MKQPPSIDSTGMSVAIELHYLGGLDFRLKLRAEKENGINALYGIGY